jgi:hypothetical protein
VAELPAPQTAVAEATAETLILATTLIDVVVVPTQPLEFVADVVYVVVTVGLPVTEEPDVLLNPGLHV